MEISVIIPVFNVELYLERAVNSILAQSIGDCIEIILVDDGSTDYSGQLCDQLAQNNKNISVIHQKNSGVSAARNAGIHAAKGTYIAFLDGDDYVINNMYEILLRNIKQENAEISCVGYSIHRRSGMKVERYNTKRRFVWNRQEAIFEMLSEKRFDFLCIDKLYKREQVIDHLFDTKIAIGEDRQFVFENINVCNKVVYEDICCYVYDRRDGSAMVSQFTEKNIVNYNVAKKMCDQVKTNYPNLRRVAECHLIRTAYKTLEKLEMVHEIPEEYADIRENLYSTIHSFKIRYSFGILSLRHIFALTLMKYCPILYIKICKIADV